MSRASYTKKDGVQGDFQAFKLLQSLNLQMRLLNLSKLAQLWVCHVGGLGCILNFMDCAEEL